ncbi:MAG: hypothetical protein ACRDQI_17080, partial [Pseudonocardiaceae bacterium]
HQPRLLVELTDTFLKVVSALLQNHPGVDVTGASRVDERPAKLPPAARPSLIPSAPPGAAEVGETGVTVTRWHLLESPAERITMTAGLGRFTSPIAP